MAVFPSRLLQRNIAYCYGGMLSSSAKMSSLPFCGFPLTSLSLTVHFWARSVWHSFAT
jgi:hypothetical protein